MVLAVGALATVALAPGVASAATTSTTATTISTAKNAKLGKILVSGTTVYALKPSKTACTAECQKTWKPVVLPDGVSSPTAGSGVDASKLGTMADADGAMQITYAGKPLYWFAKDSAPGQVKGTMTNKWGKWAPVVTAKSGAKGGTSTTNAGTGGAAF